MYSALALVPTNVLIRRFCFRWRKNTCRVKDWRGNEMSRSVSSPCTIPIMTSGDGSHRTGQRGGAPFAPCILSAWGGPAPFSLGLRSKVPWGVCAWERQYRGDLISQRPERGGVYERKS